MGQVFLNVSGSGYAYCIPPAGEQLVDGERFVIYSIPDAGCELDDIRAFDSHDYSVAIPVGQQVSMVFRSSWGNLYVDIYFTGSTPPPTPIGGLPIWLLKKAADKNNPSLMI